MTRSIIDIRNRPAFLHDFYGATLGTAAYETAKWINRRVGSREIEHFARSHTLDGYLSEIRAAGLEKAVVIGRDTPAIRNDNDQIASLVAGQAVLVGIGSVDPQRLGAEGAALEAERAVRDLGLRGINLEPGFSEPARPFDDPLLLPVYEAVSALKVPVFLMTGPTTPDLALNDPAAVGRVARAFPDLQIVVHHGFWPRVTEIIGVAFRYPNVSIVPDMYLFQPGSQPYVEAANGFLKDQFLFGSSYPFLPIRQAIDAFLALGLTEPALEAALSGNARRLLGLV